MMLPRMRVAGPGRRPASGSAKQFVGQLLRRDGDSVGGRSAAYEKELRKAKAIALEEMAREAREMGANAAIGVDLD